MWRYNLIILMLTPIIVIFTFFRAIKFKDFRYLLQRFCIIKFKNNFKERPILFHAASVGEVIAIIPLIHEITKKYSDIPIIITSNTSTSADIIKSQLVSVKNLHHYYMPIDWSWTIRRLINAINPRCILIVETELWPNLFDYSYTKKIPVIILNARLSHRTLSANSWMLAIYNQILKQTTQILARSTEDYQNFIKLGGNKSNTKLIGNIKFASSNNLNLEPITLGRPYVLAASTHDDEEKQIASIWLDLLKDKIIKTEILVFVPRHPERASIIAQQLKMLNVNISIRSRGDKITETTQIYIADTVGELKQFMINAKFVFVGGSLVAHGGQNIIEPAQLSKAVIFGPNMFNFKDETKLLLKNKAAIQVSDKNELKECFSQLLQDSDKIMQLSKLAIEIVQQQESTILKRYMVEIEDYINPIQ